MQLMWSENALIAVLTHFDCSPLHLSGADARADQDTSSAGYVA